MGTEAVIALAGLLAGLLVVGVRLSVTSAQETARARIAGALQTASEREPAELTNRADIGEYLVGALSDVAAVDYAKDPDIRRLTSEVMAIARMRQAAVVDPS